MLTQWKLCPCVLPCPQMSSEDGEWRARLVFSSWTEEQLLPWGARSLVHGCRVTNPPGLFGTVWSWYQKPRSQGLWLQCFKPKNVFKTDITKCCAAATETNTNHHRSSLDG